MVGKYAVRNVGGYQPALSPSRKLLNLLDAKDACLRLLMQQRTKGRFDLHLAVTELYEAAVSTTDTLSAFLAIQRHSGMVKR